ncbi:hypothetical protein [Novispirillum itersonii]|uniref:VCBS repeat-containing protein n=1 Tax=Novispirillum itersonii TaxID=189 RepID=A0A7X0DKP2_NOVIT|nr:hypothetical protein [Novispirillum itersonii]MBB6209161.1 hypothetical protein [Novispirillum itersonii]
MDTGRRLIRGAAAVCLLSGLAAGAVAAPAGRMTDLSGDGIADTVTVTPTSPDAAVLSVRIGRSGETASLAVGWCQGCGPVYAVFHSGMLDGDDLAVFSPDRQTLRWMQWWGGRLIEQKAIPLNGEGRGIEALDDKTVNIRLRNADMVTISF